MLAGTSVAIMAMLPAPSAFFIRFFGPESLGGIGDFGKKVDEEAARLDVPPDGLEDKVCYSLAPKSW